MIDFLKGTVTPRDWIAVTAIIGLTAALAAAFYFLVHQKQNEQLLRIQVEDTQVVADLDQARQINAQIEDLRTETAKIEQLVSEFEQRLPSRREIPTLIREFESMAYQQQLDVDLSPLPITQDERKETVPYNVVARGSYHQIAAFVNSLERFKRYVKVTNLNIGPQERGVVTARFTLNTYRFVKPTTTGAPL